MQDVSETRLTFKAATLRRDSLQQQIYDNLRNDIMTGVFRPGETLSSRSLATELGVSAMPVREALTRLTTEGALELTTSRTLRLRLLTPEDFDEITAIRTDLEGMAAERAAEQITADSLSRIGKLNDDLTAAADSGDADRYLKANATYHAEIYKMSGWPLLLSMIERLWLIVGPSIRTCVPDRDHMATSQGFHDAVMTALTKGDAKAVRAAIVDDIQTAAHDIRAFLASGEKH
ncbi:GntR family transcriptional regulator [Roseovarius sp. PS-C2]|uniref:GntR family transcriptional regulator n=1 Tax=Roseovarius sp. PS-C2 TaxID=2820814 RepID=UPI001C0B4DBC|nr:GntR family transcriptional regulator [Roseovarius sp. PS-C2]MBU3261579.1 GntR family transcriptional regulator [Roseovarius sp. PS-C2]